MGLKEIGIDATFEKLKKTALDKLDRDEYFDLKDRILTKLTDYEKERGFNHA